MYCKQQGKAAKYVQQKSICALLRLMEQFPFEDITITQICQEAQISRASFYRNFDSKENTILYCVEQLINQFRQQSEQTIMQLQEKKNVPPTAVEHLCQTLFQFIYDKKDFFLLLQKNNLFYMFQQIGMFQNDDSFYIQHLSQVYCLPELNKYLYNCVIGAQYALIEQWLENRCEEEPKQMAQLMTRLFSNLNPGWLEFFEKQVFANH